MAKLQARTVGGTEDYVVTREFRKLASESQRLDILRACFAIGAASGSISAEETAVVNEIARELDLDPAAVNEVRSAFHERLSVVQEVRRLAGTDSTESGRTRPTRIQAGANSPSSESRVSMARSMSAASITNGGLILSVSWAGPSVLSRIPRARAPSEKRARQIGRGFACRRIADQDHADEEPPGLGHRRSTGDAGPAVGGHRRSGPRSRWRAGGGPSSSITSRTARPTDAETGVAPERVEPLHPVGERVGDRPCRDHGPQRVAVAERLAHRDDIRDRTIELERPPRRPDPPEADLDLVGDGHAPAARARSNAAERKPGGGMIWPADPDADSAMTAPTG